MPTETVDRNSWILDADLYLVLDIKPPNHQSCFPQLFPRMFLILSSWKRKQSLLRLGATASWEPIPEYWADNLLLILYVGYNPFFSFSEKVEVQKEEVQKEKVQEVKLLSQLHLLKLVVTLELPVLVYLDKWL